MIESNSRGLVEIPPPSAPSGGQFLAAGGSGGRWDDVESALAMKTTSLFHRHKDGGENRGEIYGVQAELHPGLWNLRLLFSVRAVEGVVVFDRQVAA